ncbi:MarR family winged helix-turn-helix transcriptional regulator [Nonomuraea sp. NPDC050394]|uniref:MarR family winged helix-turn-helix transcriptional regulator n=1 Tax=Nonomuraea sp. NPDC050394 TaxID=3364363 RepID=UPI0037939E4D
MTQDPTEISHWRALRLLQARMDEDIARLYTEARIDGLKPSYVMELIKLHLRGPMSIKELAEAVQRTHSALSQKVAAMRRAGLVETVTGADARSKQVMLTERATGMIDRLMAEWRATESALAELESEIPYPLGQVVLDVERALERRSFHDRIAEKLATDPAWINPEG